MKTAVLMLIVSLLAACATTPWEEPPAGTLLLGQVSYVARYDEATKEINYVSDPEVVLKGPLPGKENVAPAKVLLASCNLKDPKQTRYARVRLYYYLPHGKGTSEWQEVARWTIVDTDLPIEKGNIVEVELHASTTRSRCAAVKRIWAKSMAAKSCAYIYNSAKQNLYGGGGMAYFYCPTLESDGWKQMPPTKEWVATFGPEGYYDGYSWYKPPSSEAL